VRILTFSENSAIYDRLTVLSKVGSSLFFVISMLFLKIGIKRRIPEKKYKKPRRYELATISCWKGRGDEKSPEPYVHAGAAN
jgi:hypothetical protein